MAEREVGYKQARKKEEREKPFLMFYAWDSHFSSRRPPAYEIIFLILILRWNASFPLSTAQGKYDQARLDRLRGCYKAV